MIFLSSNATGWDSLLQLLGVSALFIFVLLVTYFTTKFVGNVTLKQSKNSNFKVIETFRITQNKFLQIIKIGSRYFVVSVSKDDLRFIAELNEDDVILQDGTLKSKDSFAKLFLKINMKQTSNEKNIKNDQHDDHK